MIDKTSKLVYHVKGNYQDANAKKYQNQGGDKIAKDVPVYYFEHLMLTF